MPDARCPITNAQLPITHYQFTMKRVIVLVGLPASGKSQFARELLLSDNYQFTMKRVIVLVGLPASGKSQFARELLLSEFIARNGSRFSLVAGE